MYTIRYLVSLGLVIVACSMAYTIIVVWGINELFPLSSSSYWVVSGAVFSIIFVFGMRFYIPRLRNKW